MSIRLKIILVVLPLIIAAVVLAGMSSYFVAASAVTRVTTDFLRFKASDLEKYANSQWNLLADNGLVGRQDMETAAKAAVESFASSLLANDTETIIAVDGQGRVDMRAGPMLPKPEETAALIDLAKADQRGFGALRLGGQDRVDAYFPFHPFGWLVLVTEAKSSFYGEVENISRTSFEILAASVVASILILLALARYLTRPLEEVSSAMRRIIDSNDLSERVPVEYRDEIGQLSHTFNLMLGELDKAYEQIKHFAFGQAVAQKKERKIRNIFQLYVPAGVIDQVFENPESMLIGDNALVSILFSDIRSFTTISENMRPEDLVDSLNRYFSVMVDTIDARGGIVDKYIGDAIMAVFGAPIRHEEDALQSVLAGLEMTEALEGFNEGQAKRGKPSFLIGVGINYGVVTVGNIGCDKKMNYTVIGDSVNLASRLEGATKMYKQPLIISEGVHYKVKDKLPCRHLDTIAVKGKSKGVKIYAPRRSLSPEEERIWEIHEKSMDAYFKRDFKAAGEGFGRILERSSGDFPAKIFLERSIAFSKDPPAPDWDGVEVLLEK
jgi:adenylate cyclase